MVWGQIDPRDSSATKRISNARLSLSENGTKRSTKTKNKKLQLAFMWVERSIIHNYSLYKQNCQLLDEESNFTN